MKSMVSALSAAILFLLPFARASAQFQVAEPLAKGDLVYVYSGTFGCRVVVFLTGDPCHAGVYLSQESVVEAVGEDKGEAEGENGNSVRSVTFAEFQAGDPPGGFRGAKTTVLAPSEAQRETIEAYVSSKTALQTFYDGNHLNPKGGYAGGCELGELSCWNGFDYFNEFDCVGLTERAYEVAGLNPIPGLEPFPLTPFDQYASTSVTPTWTALANGQSASSRVRSQGWSYFKIEVPEGAFRFKVTVSGNSGDVGLYVSNLEFPTLTSYDCFSNPTSGSGECSFIPPVPGEYFIGVYGFGFDPGFRTFQVEARHETFSTGMLDTLITGGPEGTIDERSIVFTFIGSSEEPSGGELRFSARLDPIQTTFLEPVAGTARAYYVLPDGDYTFYVKAVDENGKEDPTPASRSFRVLGSVVDSHPPETVIVSGPSGNVTNTDTVSFEVRGSDDTAKPVELRYSYRLDPVEPSFSVPGGNFLRTYHRLEVGSYTLYVKAVDLTGKEDPTPASRSFTIVDDSPPETVVGTWGEPPGFRRDVTFLWAGNDNRSAPEDLVYAYRFAPLEPDFSAFGPAEQRTYESLLKGKTYTFQVKARDKAGNEDPTPATLTFYLDIMSDRGTPAADFDGDGVADHWIYRNGAWLRFGPCSEGAATCFSGVWTGPGHPGCIPAPADYDGDRRIDLAQLCGGAWHFYNEDGSYRKGIWTGGVPGDLPAPADFDGDGAAEVVVFRSGAWFFYDNTTGGLIKSVWTGPADRSIPLPMDYDADFKADLSVYREGAWHFFNDDGTYNKGIWTGGVPGDVPVPGDYNGIGRDEVVVFRGGTWMFYRFSDGQYYMGVWTGAASFGGRPLQPTPLDRDGDGTLDFGVYAGGPWHFYHDDGTYSRGIWTGGLPDDQPISGRQPTSD